MASVVEEQKRCTYCFQELNEMTDPRQLPCTHIVCLPCLKNDWKLYQLECRVCRVKANVKELNTLPKVVHITEEPESGDVDNDTRMSMCDVCKTEEPAVVYCEDCGKKLCTRHKESHEDFFGDAHKMVSITKYIERPNMYAKTICKHHPTNFITHACKLCFKMPCSYCAPGHCDILATEHQFQTLEKARSDAQVELDQRLAKCSEKIAELCNLEKLTWRKVDDLNEKCEALLKQVDTTAEQQINDIQDRAANLKERSSKYQAGQLRSIEEYIANLISKVETLESAQVSTSRFLNESTTTDIVQQKREVIEKLDKDNRMDSTSQHEVEVTILVSRGRFRELELVTAPAKSIFSRIKFQVAFELARGDHCRSITFNRVGELIFACSANILIGKGEKFGWREPKDMIIHTDIQSLSQPSNIFTCGICVLSPNGWIYVISPTGVSHSMVQLFKLPESPDAYRKMCASHRYIAAAQATNKLLIYDMNSKQGHEHCLPNISSIRSICFDTDDDLIVLGSTNNRLNKYMILETSRLELVWSRSLPAGAYAVCIDRSGERKDLVFVSGADKTLSIIENGYIVQTLQSESLPDHDLSTGEFSEISVHGNTLATTQDRNKNISIFHLGV